MMNNNTPKELNIDELAAVAGGDGLRDRPEYNIIKEFYVKQGINSAMDLALRYGFNGAEIFEMMKIIGEEVEQGNNTSNAF